MTADESNLSSNEQLYVCECAEVYGSHHPECPAQRQLDRQRAEIERLKRELRLAESARDYANAMLDNARSSDETSAEHAHTDECWEPDSGCDLGRNEQHVQVVRRCAVCGLPHEGLTGYNHPFTAFNSDERNTETCPTCFQSRSAAFYRDAAEREVERLRQYEPLKGGMPLPEFLLRQERDRLRRALERLTDGYKYPAEVCQIAREALSGESSSPETGNDPGVILNELWSACRVVFYPELGDLRGDYPIEHASGAAKDARDLIEARLAERILQRAKLSQKASGESP